MNSKPLHILVILGVICTLSPSGQAELDAASSDAIISRVRLFADTILEHGRDTNGARHTPLFADGLQVETLEPAIWAGPDGQRWILSNFASQQALMRLLDGLTPLTGEPKYRAAAEAAVRHVLQHVVSPNGLVYQGGHAAWDLIEDRHVGQSEPPSHELKGQQAYYELMWRVDPNAARTLMETIWAAHILDWELLDYNRHGNMNSSVMPAWDHAYNTETEVPFPAKGSNLSFVNVIPPLMRSGSMLAILDKNDDALTWTRRLVNRWQEGKHPETGLCGGQLSYREHDRAQDALGHVHPDINEARIVASYHQTGRYHALPLAQMQAAEKLLGGGGKYEKVGRELIAWASEDLKIYARTCFDPNEGLFVARMTDGTPLDWRKARPGYYIADSFAPAKPDGRLFWGYALAYRLTRDPEHWRMARQIAASFGLGDFGEPDGAKRNLATKTRYAEAASIYSLIELHKATQDASFLALAGSIAQNLLDTQTGAGLFPRRGRMYARTGDEIPLALLHLAAAMQGKSELVPQAVLDRSFFHCVYHGELEPHQEKRDDTRTYDSLVFYGN